MPSPHLPLRPGRWLAALLALLLGGPAQAASAVLIWPINPAIEADQPATALWLENRGKQPVTLQVRVLGLVPGGFPGRLSQPAGSDSQPALRQGRAGPPATGPADPPGRPAQPPEDAYRVLIDEVPDGDA
ncbi:hypothetical protein AM469_005026, partial [Pseudomonas aeruginosa]